MSENDEQEENDEAISIAQCRDAIARLTRGINTGEIRGLFVIATCPRSESSVLAFMAGLQPQAEGLLIAERQVAIAKAQFLLRTCGPLADGPRLGAIPGGSDGD